MGDDAIRDRAGEVTPDRFEIRGTLGSGGVGVVYRAWDSTRGAEVALKALHRASPLDLLRFKREFRALADIAHPNLATLYELHTSGDEWFFTMEIVEGTPFIRYVRPYEPIDPRAATPPPVDEPTRTSQVPSSLPPPTSRVLRERIVAATLDRARLDAALPQLVDGVHALHRAGKLHRDLKPSNVLVEPGGRLVLLDFGLIADIAELDRTQDTLAGTPGYMAPEQIGDAPLGEGADWYSVGVMLYEALSGRRPFEGTPREVMAAKQLGEPPPVSSLVPDAPPHLAELCTALLRRDPGRRPDADAIYAALGRGPSAATLALGSAAPVFVGRGAELALLRDALASSRQAGTAVFLRGPSGMGKSALMRHFLDEIADGTDGTNGAIVLEGRCYQRESVPYKALDTVIDALSAHLARLSDAEVSELVPRDASSLTGLFPVLRRVSALDMPGLSRPPDPVELRRRAFGALRVLLARLAADRPMVIAIDDLQWGDADSASFLAEMIHHPKAPAVLLLATYRSEREDDAAVLQQIRRGVRQDAIREITVGGLGEDDALALLADSGTADAARAHALVRDCGGNPFFLTELARSAGDDSGPVELDAVLRRHVERLPDDARALLELCAVAARPVGAELALRAAGIEREGATVATLHAERLVRIRRVRGAQLIEPYHDRIRDAVVRALDATARRGLHRSLAEALESSAVRDHEALVEHWREAGDLARAARHAATGAIAAEEALAFHQAARLYAFAIEFAEGEARRTLRARLGQVLIYAGRLDEAADVFAAAAQAAAAEGAPAGEVLELHRHEVEQRLRSGQLDAAMAGMKTLLGEIGVTLPPSRRGLILRLLGESIKLRLRGREPSSPPRLALTPELDRRIHVLWSMAIGMSFVNPVLGRVLQLRLMRDALDSGQKNYQAIASLMAFGYLASTGLKTRPVVEELRTRSLAIAEELGEPWLQGWIHAGGGFASYLYGRYREARERLTLGQEILRDRCVGVRWQLDIVEIYQTATLWCLGDTAELVRLVPHYVREAQERGDRLAERGLRSWRSNAAWLVMDQPDEAEAHVDASVPPRASGESFQLKHYYELMSRAQIDLYRGDGAAAHRRCTEAWPELDRSMILRVQTVRLEGWYLRGRAALAAAAASGDPEPLLREAERAAKVIERERVGWALAFASALRATVAHRRGDVDHARSFLAEASAGFSAADMALYAAAAERRRGALLGGHEGASIATAATATMYAGKVVDPARMTAMLLPAW